MEKEQLKTNCIWERSKKISQIFLDLIKLIKELIWFYYHLLLPLIKGGTRLFPMWQF